MLVLALPGRTLAGVLAVPLADTAGFKYTRTTAELDAVADVTARWFTNNALVEAEPVAELVITGFKRYSTGVSVVPADVWALAYTNWLPRYVCRLNASRIELDAT